MIWFEVTDHLPADHRNVLLCRSGDLYPVVGARWGTDPHGDDPKRVLWILEEGGAEGRPVQGHAAPSLGANALGSLARVAR